MPQPVSSHIVSTPSVDGQPYDATSDATYGPWNKLTENSGPVSQDSGRPEGGDFAGGSRWEQT